MWCLRIQLFSNQRSLVFLDQGFLTVHKSVFFISSKKLSQRVPDMVLRVFSSEMNCCLKCGIHEHSPNSQNHIQIFHRIVWLCSVDLPDHREDGFHVVRCVWRYVEIMFPCGFRILLTFLLNWRTGSVCKGLPPSFTVLGNGFLRNLFPFEVPDLSLRIVGVFWIFFFLMRRVSPLLFH